MSCVCGAALQTDGATDTCTGCGRHHLACPNCGGGVCPMFPMPTLAVGTFDPRPPTGGAAVALASSLSKSSMIIASSGAGAMPLQRRSSTS